MNRFLMLISFTAIISISCNDNEPIEKHYENIELLIDNNELKKAKKEINLLIDKHPNNSYSYTLKGIIETKLNENNLALISFKTALTIDTCNFKTYVERALLKINLGDYCGAIDDCNKARSISINYNKIYKTKGMAYELLEDVSNAIIQYEHSIKHGDCSAEIFHKLGVLYLSNGNKEKACLYFRKAGDLGFIESYEQIKSFCN